MSTLTLRLPDDLKSRLAVAARRLGKTPERFVRESLEKRLRPNQPGSTGSSSLYERSRHLCGSVTGGPRDLASNKKHLNGYGSWKP